MSCYNTKLSMKYLLHHAFTSNGMTNLVLIAAFTRIFFNLGFNRSLIISPSLSFIRSWPDLQERLVSLKDKYFLILVEVEYSCLMYLFPMLFVSCFLPLVQHVCHHILRALLTHRQPLCEIGQLRIVLILGCWSLWSHINYITFKGWKLNIHKCFRTFKD
jgi:hypothetical protein